VALVELIQNAMQKEGRDQILETASLRTKPAALEWQCSFPLLKRLLPENTAHLLLPPPSFSLLPSLPLPCVLFHLAT